VNPNATQQMEEQGNGNRDNKNDNDGVGGRTVDANSTSAASGGSA